MNENAQPAVLAIVGPGALGCLFASALHEAGVPVVLVDKNPDRAARVRREGVRVTGPRGDRRVAVPVTADPASLPPPAYVCICVKAYHTGAALAHVRTLLAGGAHVVSLQNGLGNAELAAAAVGAGRVLCAATSCGATGLGAGAIREAGRGPTLVAPFGAGAAPAVPEFIALLRAAEFDVASHDNAQSVLWSKVVVNAAINPVTALHDVANGAILESDDLRSMAMEAAREAGAVVRAAGVSLLFRDPEEEVQRVCRCTADNVSSMLQDVRAGRRTEIDSISGAVAAEARRRDIATPVTEALLRRVRAL